MKMRVRSNSVRFRLTKTEVAAMQGCGECSEYVRFPDGGCLAYSLIASESASVQAEFELGSVKIRVPRREVLEWSGTEAVGIYSTVESNGIALDVIVEKDFQCLDADTLEDQSDMFSNPMAGALSC